MVLPDLHFPHHDKKALGAVLALHDRFQPAQTVILGDWLDCEGFSSHKSLPKVEDRATYYLEHEITPCRAMLATLERNTARLDYLEGNHEWRVERALNDLGAMGAHLRDLASPRRLLSEDRKPGWSYVNYAKAIMAPLPHVLIAERLVAVHGWSVAKHSAARHLDLARGYSVVHGHTHRKQRYTSREPITGEVFEAWSPGCLCLQQPLYMAHNPAEWTHGVTLIAVTEDGREWTAWDILVREGVALLPDGTRLDGSSRTWQRRVRQIERGVGA